jgi:hypothetical protein
VGTRARCEEMLARGAREKWFIFPILRVRTRLSLHDSAQQEPSAAPPRVRARLNQSLKALIAFESVPLGGVGLSGDGPRGAGSPGRSRAGRAPAGGQPGGTSGARRAAEKPWRGGGAGELLGGTGGWVAGGRGAAGGWDCVKSGFIFPIRPRAWSGSGPDRGEPDGPRASAPQNI